MDPKYLADIERLYELGASFTPLNGKVPIMKAWAAQPREELAQALEWAKVGNVGLRTGGNSGGIVVVDVESDAEPGAYEALGLPPTVAVRTGSGGFHYYFRANGHRIKNSAKKLFPDIDVRGDGGQVVFPGSVHPETGQTYEFIAHPSTVEIALLPDEFVKQHAPKILKDYKPPKPAAPVAPPATDGHPYLRRALEEECRNVATAVEGTRNDTLNTAAFKLGSLVGANALHKDEAEGALLSAAFQCGLGEVEARHAIRSGMEAGMRSPRTLPDSVTHPREPWQPRDEDAPSPRHEVEPVFEVPEEYLEQHGPPGGPPAEPPGPPPLYKQINVTRGFLAENRRIVFYRDTFYIYNGQFYLALNDSEMHGRLTVFVTGTVAQPKNWSLPYTAKDEEAHVPFEMHPVENCRVKIGPVDPSLTFISQVLNRIRGECELYHDSPVPYWLDRREPASNELVMTNGILNTNTLELAPLTDSLFSLGALPYAFDPKASYPGWLRFINEISNGDESMMCILQEVFGYCLTSGQEAQKIILFVGEGNNGKSVCADMLREMVGVINVSTVPIEVLGDPHMTSAMVGKLVNLSSEWHHIESSAEGILKAISGGDSIYINPKHKTPYNAPISAKLVVVTNEAPSIKDKSMGMWRRLMPIPFEYEVPADKVIPKPALIENLRAELPGILNWALEGLKAFRIQRGFSSTEGIGRKLEEYRAEVSPTWTWAEASLAVMPGYTLKSEDAYSNYSKWARENGHNPLNSVHFNRELGRWFRHNSGKKLVRTRVQDGGVRYQIYSDLSFAVASGTLPPGLGVE